VIVLTQLSKRKSEQNSSLSIPLGGFCFLLIIWHVPCY